MLRGKGPTRWCISRRSEPRPSDRDPQAEDLKHLWREGGSLRDQDQAANFLASQASAHKKEPVNTSS